MAPEIQLTHSEFPSAGSYQKGGEPARIHVLSWADAAITTAHPPRGVIQLNHGMCEYVARYDPLARALAACGWLVVGMDFIGHGDSAPEPGQLGYTGWPLPDGLNVFVEDLATLRRRIQQRWPDLPLVLFGHSMGSFVLRAYLADHGAGLAGAIICGTGTLPRPLLRGGLGALTALERSHGPEHRSAWFDRLTVGAYNKPFARRGARTDFDWLSRDPAAVDAYVSDPRCGFLFTLAANRQLLDAFSRAEAPEAYQTTPRDLPLLVISGADDPVGGQGQGVRRVAARYRATGLSQLRLKLYPGARHEILHEINRAEVIRDLVAWVNAR